MTYEAEVQFKFDATYTHTYGSFLDADDYIPEEHYKITAPAADLMPNSISNCLRSSCSVWV